MKIKSETFVAAQGANQIEISLILNQIHGAFICFEKLIEKAPERVLEFAVKGMLPKGPLGREMFRKLKVYAGAEHMHAAQQPQPLEL